MYRLYLVIALTVFVVSGCGSCDSGNENTNADNANAENINANQETAGVDEEVPSFDDAEKALAKGIEYLDDDKFVQAIDALRQAVDLDKDLADAHFQLGVALSLKESEEERKVPDEFVSDEGTEKETKKAKSTEKKESEIAFENAVKAYKKMIAKDREDDRAYYNLGRSYVKLFDDNEARKALEQAVKLNGEESVYRTELGAVLIKLAQYASAIKQLDKAIELDEANYRAEDLLAKAQAGKKRVDHGQTQKPKTIVTNSSEPANSGGREKVNSGDTRPREVNSKPEPPKKVDIKPAPTAKNKEG